MTIARPAAPKKTKPIRQATRIDQWSGEKRRIDSDLSAAVKNLRGRAVVVTDCCNEKAGGICGVADTADFSCCIFALKLWRSRLSPGVNRLEKIF